MTIEVPQVYSDMVQWRDDHEKNVQVIERLLNNEKVVNEYGQDSIFALYEEKREEIGTEFDFMEGKDPANDKEYAEQLGKLAQGDMSLYDTDGDGVVSRSEYIAGELKDLHETDSKELKELTATYAYLMFDVIDQAMGNSNANGALEMAEFESFYRNLDCFNGETLGDEDGKLDIDACSTFATWLVDNIFSDETFFATYDIAKKLVD